MHRNEKSGYVIARGFLLEQVAEETEGELANPKCMEMAIKHGADGVGGSGSSVFLPFFCLLPLSRCVAMSCHHVPNYCRLGLYLSHTGLDSRTIFWKPGNDFLEFRDSGAKSR